MKKPNPQIVRRDKWPPAFRDAYRRLGHLIEDTDDTDPIAEAIVRDSVRFIGRVAARGGPTPEDIAQVEEWNRQLLERLVE